MMNKIIKYIINENKTPVFFGCDILHTDVMSECPKLSGFLIVKYNAEVNKFVVKCFGNSTDLQTKSNLKINEKIIEDFLNN